MDKKIKTFIAIFFVALIATLAVLISRGNLMLLNPAGTLASEEKHLIILATLLMLIVVIPVFILTFAIAWRYRESNTKAKYSPDWDKNTKLELTWWAIPGAIILVLAIVTWTSSHRLDPFRPLAENNKTLPIQVVALDWKWLFIYPQQNIASVNFVEIPKDTAVDFIITSDAPMNSFWIPQLSGQIYAMAGMKTQLHVMATKTGTFYGQSANISGRGFSGMKFDVKSVEDTDFRDWVTSLKDSKDLTFVEYDSLARPSENEPVRYFGGVEQGLFDRVISKYAGPGMAHGGSF